MHFYLFIYCLINLVPLIDYEKERSKWIFQGFQQFSKHYHKYIYLFVYLFILFFSYPIYGLTNPTSLIEISSPRFVRNGVYNHVISNHMHIQNLRMMHNLLTTHGVN
jgi:hypothetical protein